MSGFTETDLAALTNAMKNGVLEVDYPSGQRVKYQKLSDMIDLRDRMIRDINRALRGGGPSYAVFDGYTSNE